MEGAFLVDVVLHEGARVIELLARKDEPLPVGWSAIKVVDHRFDGADRVRRSDRERHASAGE